MKRGLVFWVPLGAFMLFLAVVATGLYFPADKAVRSGLIGRALPEFALPAAVPGRPGLSSASLRAGTPAIVNIFASWCVPCRAEALQLETLSRQGANVVGIAIRDRQEDLEQFLTTYGDPFRAIGADADRRVQMDLGSAGVPETFVIDGRGIIRHQHVGVITEADLPGLMAAYEAAR